MTHSYSTQCAGDMAACEGLPPLNSLYVTTPRERALEEGIQFALQCLKDGSYVSAEAFLKDALAFQYGKEDE